MQRFSANRGAVVVVHVTENMRQWFDACKHGCERRRAPVLKVQMSLIADRAVLFAGCGWSFDPRSIEDRMRRNMADDNIGIARNQPKLFAHLFFVAFERPVLVRPWRTPEFDAIDSAAVILQVMHVRQQLADF